MIHFFKICNEMAPSYSRSNFIWLDSFYGYGTCGSDANYHILLEISLAPDSLTLTVIRCWNSLPVALKSIVTPESATWWLAISAMIKCLFYRRLSRKKRREWEFLRLSLSHSLSQLLIKSKFFQRNHWNFEISKSKQFLLLRKKIIK